MNGRARYKLTHWGKAGPVGSRSLVCADPRAGGLVELGELVEIVYLTQKGGDAGRLEYEHRFALPRPVLAHNAGGLVICGGRYRITMRGIVG